MRGQSVYTDIGAVIMGRNLFDQIVMNVVPVVFGGGRPFFGAMEPGDNVTSHSATRPAVARDNRVTHLLYDVYH